MRKEPLLFNIESKNKPIKDEVFCLNMFEPFGMFINDFGLDCFAYYTTEEFWKMKVSEGMEVPSYYLFLSFDKINYRSAIPGSKYKITISEFVNAMSEGEQEQFYLNLPELTELLKL